jgi:hypothetical protein
MWRVGLEPGSGVQPVVTGSGAVLARRDGQLVNLLPHLSAAVALYGLPGFPRVDVDDLSGAPGFTGTPVPRTMLDGDDDRWFGFSDENEYRLIGRRT